MHGKNNSLSVNERAKNFWTRPLPTAKLIGTLLLVISCFGFLYASYLKLTAESKFDGRYFSAAVIFYLSFLIVMADAVFVAFAVLCSSIRLKRKRDMSKNK